MPKPLFFFIIASLLCLVGAAQAERVIVGGQGLSGDQSSREACPVISYCPTPDNTGGGLAFDGTFLWSTYYFSSTAIYPIDPVTCAVGASIPGPSSEGIGGLAFDGSSLWACVEQEGLIYEINPVNGEVLSVIPAPGFGDADPNSSGLAFDGMYLWHADYGHDTIYKLDPTDGTILDSFPSPGDCPSGLGYYAPGNVLILGDCISGELYQINLSDGSVTASCGAPEGRPWGVAVTGATVWENESSLFGDRLLYQIASEPVATEVQPWGSVKSIYR